jgi:hypothetical protein
MRRELVLLAAALLLAPAVSGAAVQVEAESVYRSYDTPGLTEEDVVLQPFSQAFRLTAGERWENSRVGFETYVRGIGDQTQRGPGFRDASRVYYAYLDLVYGRRHPIDMRLGRQTLTTGGDLVAFDGARVRYRGPLFVGVELFGGTTVSGFGAVVPQNIGEGGGSTIAGGTTGGVQLFLTGVSETQARLGFRRIDRDGAVDREDVVADFAQRFGRFRVYGSGELSTVLLQVEEGVLGTSVSAGYGTYAEVEGFHYTPVFGASSIFNVFNIEPYDEVRLRVRTSQRFGRLGGYLKLGHAIYGGGETSDNVALGGSWRLTPRVAFSARTFVSNGYQGNRTGASAETNLKLLDAGKMQLILGGTWASAENSLLTTNGGTYLSAMGGIAYVVEDRAELSVLAEQFSDDFTSGEPRITASFRFKFGAGYARTKGLDPAQRRVSP